MLVKVEAPEGVTVVATVEKKTLKASVITEQGFDENGNPAIVTRHGPKQTVWEAKSTDQFATEVRTYDLAADERVVASAIA